MSDAQVSPPVWLWGICLTHWRSLAWSLCVASVSPLCLNPGAIEAGGRAIQSGIAAALTGGAATRHDPAALQGASRAGEGEGEVGQTSPGAFHMCHESDWGCTAVCGGGESWVLGCSILPLPSASSIPHVVAHCIAIRATLRHTDARGFTQRYRQCAWCMMRSTGPELSTWGSGQALWA